MTWTASEVAVDGPDERTEDAGAEAGRPGDVQPLEGERPSVWSKDTLGAFPTTPPRDVTPLEDDERGGAVPPAVLFAMKDRRHVQLPHPFGHPSRLRAAVGAGDAAVFAIDDGARHCMIGRRVGATRDGAVYVLVGRVARSVYDDLSAGRTDGRRAFLEAQDTALLGTGEEPGLANVFDVDFYSDTADIPPEYLPPSPAIDFAEDLPTADR
ncbi:MAG: hypothetical protein JO368_12640 [Acidimicrobiales bacterium]|nr:hypothetical protein [Acidimicrobiales bacterium]